MTINQKQLQRCSLPETGDIPVRVHDYAKQWHTMNSRNVQIRSQVVTGWTKASPQNVPPPRDGVNEPFSRYGVGRRARVDPFREDGAHTAGPTCTPQRGHVRKAPESPRTRLRSASEEGVVIRAGRGRAADISRPGAPCNGATVGSAYVRTRIRSRSTPIPVVRYVRAIALANRTTGVGCTMPQRSVEM